MIALERPALLSALAERVRGASGEVRRDREVTRVAPVRAAERGDLAPLLHAKYAGAAREAAARGAAIMASAEVARGLEFVDWVHPFGAWALAHVLDLCRAELPPARVGEGATIGEHVVLERGVVLGARVQIGHGSVIGRPGFGWAAGPRGEVRAMPHLGGVVIEDGAVIGALCTVDAGTLSPTFVRRGAKLDAHVHVAHNCDIGEGTMIAAQSGFAGSVVVGRGVLIGGQAGVADHVTIGDGAKIAAKSGVIGDVPPGAVVAGYPAVARARWLRALARAYRRDEKRR